MKIVPVFDFSAERAGLEAELELALNELPALRATADATKTAAEDARYRFALFCQRCNAALRVADDTGPALRRMSVEEQGARDRANAAAERARRLLANGLFRAECLRVDIDQIERCQNPVSAPPRYEIAKRPRPDLGSFDNIVMPNGAAAEAP